MERQKVSIVMPAYNGEKFIKQAIESVLIQSYSNWELVIVDDCSTDNTMDIIKGFDDSRIRLYQNDSNRGISYSTNRAISVSNGEYIALLDDDDMMTDRRLELQVEYLTEHPEIDVLGGSHLFINENSKVVKAGREPIHNPKLIKSYMHFINWRFSNGTTTFRKRFVDAHGLKFEENCYGMQDFKFIIECTKLGLVSSIGQVLQLKRIHDKNETLIQTSSHEMERKKKFAEFQRMSITKSGFNLSESQFQVINSCITEQIRSDCSKEEIVSLWDAMQTLIYQAYERNLDYAAEMEFACKRIFCERVLERCNCNTLDDIFKGEKI